jgi:S-methylmethionine-dependent homocysteine/selenocysteine methylase
MTRQPDCTLSDRLVDLIADQGLEALPDLIRIIINAAMQAERQQYLNAAPYERTDERRGYANGFTQIPKAFMPGKTRLMLRSREDLDPAAYAEHALGWWRAGARLLGGCCEVGPEHIAHLHQRLTDSGARVVTELA